MQSPAAAVGAVLAGGADDSVTGAALASLPDAGSLPDDACVLVVLPLPVSGDEQRAAANTIAKATDQRFNDVMDRGHSTPPPRVGSERRHP